MPQAGPSMSPYYPPPLRPGDRVRIVAPSGPFDSTLLSQGLQRLSDFEVVRTPGVADRRAGFFAGTDSERLEELMAALTDAKAAAIWVARGGYGLGRLAPEVKIPSMPPWLVGFSDATVLHLALSKAGIASVHAGNGTTLAKARDEDVEETMRLLSGLPPRPLHGLTPINLNRAEVSGRLVGGNLTVLFSEAASGRLKLPAGCVLFLEDVTETSYRIDRMLTALMQAGHFSRVGAVLLGDFTDCSAGKFGVKVEDVLDERLGCLGVPVLRGLPVGHGDRNWPLLIGSQAELDPRRGRLVCTRC